MDELRIPREIYLKLSGIEFTKKGFLFLLSEGTSLDHIIEIAKWISETFPNTETEISFLSSVMRISVILWKDVSSVETEK